MQQTPGLCHRGHGLSYSNNSMWTYSDPRPCVYRRDGPRRARAGMHACLLVTQWRVLHLSLQPPSESFAPSSHVRARTVAVPLLQLAAAARSQREQIEMDIRHRRAPFRCS